MSNPESRPLMPPVTERGLTPLDDPAPGAEPTTETAVNLANPDPRGTDVAAEPLQGDAGSSLPPQAARQEQGATPPEPEGDGAPDADSDPGSPAANPAPWQSPPSPPAPPAPPAFADANDDTNDDANDDDAFPGEVEMTLVDHLEELRRRLLRSLVVLLIAAAGCLLAVKPLVR